MTEDSSALFEAIDATWPAARQFTSGPWVLRNGQGGGKRVSAATALQLVDPEEIALAEDQMRALAQPPLFMLRDADDALDRDLEQRGYKIVDPVVVLTCPITRLTDQPVPPVTTFVIWEPLAIMVEMWAAGGIGPARLEVMRRAKTKTAILARNKQKPAGTAFVAVHENIAMVHAVEVLKAHRRQGIAGWIMRQAAFWAQEQGATQMAVLCTKANTAALRLYSGLGFETAAQYHYRYNPAGGDLHNV
ncbi:MAG: GNAT family N-acetyltransferase [Roseobacter sp.]